MFKDLFSQSVRAKRQKARSQRTSVWAIAAALLLGGGLNLWGVKALANTPAGTEIRNTAVGAFEDPDNLGNILEVTSNEVVLTVAEVAGITVTSGPTGVVEAAATINNAGPNQADGDINPEDVVYFTFTIANIGNDATQFFIPDAPSAITGGTLSGEIQLIAYDPDGTGSSTEDLTSNNITVPAGGATTGALLSGLPATYNGSVLRNGAITIRVPIKIDAGLSEGDKVTVVMGDTPSPPNASDQNQPYSAGVRDIYTQDNPDGTTDETAGDPTNGDAVDHRQEASARQSVPVGIATGNIAGRVWRDSDGNGIRSNNEAGIDGVLVEVLDADGVSQGVVNTAGGGLYEFFNLPVGSYVVQFAPPDNVVVSPLDAGSDDTIDSDVKQVVNQTNLVAVVNGAVTGSVDLGLIPDSDADSATDPVEGTGDIDGDGTPNFLDFDPTGYFYDEATGEIIPGGLVNISGDGAEQLHVAFDGSNGYYQWLGEVPGVYTQTIILPPGYAFGDSCFLRPKEEALDPTGGPSPTIIGSFQQGTTSFLQNTDCAPAYLTFDLAPGDPVVINNNIPLKAIATLQDYGDAPDKGVGTGPANYQTVAIDNGPVHEIVSGIQLGSAITSDNDGASFGEAGDATEDGGDDGVQLAGADLQGQSVTPGEAIALDITTQGSGVLSAWIDWNADGDFEDAGETVASDVAPADGVIAINITVPTAAVAGDTYARFRYSSQTGLNPSGPASDGEVEDYKIAIAAPTSISSRVIEDANYNGLQDDSETGIDGVTVKLLDTDGVEQSTTTTAGGGLYTFSDIAPGAYLLEFESPENFVFSPQDVGGDESVDFDANRVTGQTDTVVVGENETIDNIAAGFSPDADGDTIPDIVDGTGDRDRDTVPDFLDVDPAGYFYDEATGEVIPGALITVSGPGAVRIADDGSATGFFQWFIDGTSGTYTMTVTPPPGYELSTACRPSTSPPSPFDPTGLTPDPYELGEAKNDQTNALFASDCASNPYYFSFDLASGDPFVINNNIPLTAIPIAEPVTGATAADQPSGGIALGSGTNFCSDNNFLVRQLNIDSSIPIGGISLGLNISHPYRGALRGLLQAPDGRFIEFMGINSSDIRDNYDVLFQDGGAALDSGTNDNVGAPLYERTVAPATSFSALLDSPSLGNWQMYLCDAGSRQIGTYNSAQLTLTPPDISGYAFDDTNGSNQRESIEGVLANIGVTAYLDDGDGVFEPGAGDAAVAATNTRASGLYSFTDLASGSYWINIDENDPDLAGRAFSGSVIAGTANPRFVSFVDSAVTDIDFPFIQDLTALCEPGDPSGQLAFIDNATLESGSALQIGAVYRFANIFENVDGLVEIVAFNGGATLGAIDNDSTGVLAALQPTLNGTSGATSSVDFTITMVEQGTTTPVAITFKAAGVDIDGDSGTLREFIELTNLTSFTTGSSITATPITSGTRFESNTTVAQPGVSATATQTIAIAQYNSISQLRYRIGGIDEGTSAAIRRLNSLYFGCTSGPVVSNADVLLVKRITAINGDRTQNPNDSTALNTVVNDGVNNSSDDNGNWPNNYLLGELDAGAIKPGDEIEYTVYFLSAGNSDAADVRICDWIQANQTFVAESYTDGDILLQLGDGTESTSFALSAADDAGDRAQLTTVGSLPTDSGCNLPASATNTEDAVIAIDITGTAGSPTNLTVLPATTGQGTPDNAFGLFRFTTRVNSTP